MLRVRTRQQGTVTLKHFSVARHHVETLTKIVKDDLMADMSLSCQDEGGKQTSVPAFEVDVTPFTLRQLNPEMQ